MEKELSNLSLREIRKEAEIKAIRRALKFTAKPSVHPTGVQLGSTNRGKDREGKKWLLLESFLW